MAWTAEARRRSIESRRRRRQEFDRLDWEIAMRVAAAGSGLARLQRCIEARYWRDPGQQVPHRVTRMKVYRLVVRMGLREAICPGKFRAGNVGAIGEGLRCRTCREDLSASPWCVCVPIPVFTCPDCAEERKLGDMSLCWCERKKPVTKPKRRLQEWMAAVREDHEKHRRRVTT